MFLASRYDKGYPDFLNIPLNEVQYNEFIDDLNSAEKVIAHDFEEERYFESCLPIETLAARGPRTLAFGPMKPVGLFDPKAGRRPYAVVQLRAENSYLTAYNLVGFQTKMKYGEQERIFRKLPGLAHAEFLRLGSITETPTSIRPTSFAHAPTPSKTQPFRGLAHRHRGLFRIIGYWALGGWNAARFVCGEDLIQLPVHTMLGALVHAITDPSRTPFQPMNVNFGVLPPLEPLMKRDKKTRNELLLLGLNSLFRLSYPRQKNLLETGRGFISRELSGVVSSPTHARHSATSSR